MHLASSSPVVSGERGVDMHFHLLVVKIWAGQLETKGGQMQDERLWLVQNRCCADRWSWGKITVWGPEPMWGLPNAPRICFSSNKLKIHIKSITLTAVQTQRKHTINWGLHVFTLKQNAFIEPGHTLSELQRNTQTLRHVQRARRELPGTCSHACTHLALNYRVRFASRSISEGKMGAGASSTGLCSHLITAIFGAGDWRVAKKKKGNRF